MTQTDVAILGGGINGSSTGLELAKNGKSVPANVLQAYMPAIIILDNIAKGGTGFVNALRALENRAQNSRK